MANSPPKLTTRNENGAMFGPLFWQLRMADVEVALLLKLLAPNESALLTYVICSGTNFLPCASRLGYNAPGAYPVNFLLLNPYSAGSLFYVDDKGWHDYNGLQIQLTKRFSHGLIWQSYYTFSKGLTNLAASKANQQINWTTLRNESLDRGPSGFARWRRRVCKSVLARTAGDRSWRSMPHSR